MKGKERAIYMYTSFFSFISLTYTETNNLWNPKAIKYCVESSNYNLALKTE